MIKPFRLIFVTLFLLTVLVNAVSAQFLNNSFEDWSTDGNPVYWFTGNAPGIVTPVTQSSESQNGSSSVKVEIVEYFGGYYSGILQSSDSTYIYGHPINQNYSSVNGYFKFEQSGAAALSLVAVIYNEEYSPIGSGVIEIQQAVSNWTQFQVPILYSPGEAATVVFQISVYDTSDGGVDPNSIGAYALIDNLSFGAPTDVGEELTIPANYKLNQNYPNPFNPATTISYSIPVAGNVQLTIYDVLGNSVAVLEKGYKQAGNYRASFNANNLSSGTYFYKIKAGEFIETKKMLLIK